MAWNWNEDRAAERIEKAVEKVEIREFVRQTDILDLSPSVAYKVSAVHLYIDLLNFSPDHSSGF